MASVMAGFPNLSWQGFVNSVEVIYQGRSFLPINNFRHPLPRVKGFPRPTKILVGSFS